MSNESPTANSKDQFPHTDVANNEEGGTPQHVERGGEVRADTPDKWSEDDTARQIEGVPEKRVDRDHKDKRRKQEAGNRGPDEEPGFREGA